MSDASASASRSSFDLADETWTNAEWTESRFNCYDSCSGSASGQKFVADTLDKSKSGPMGNVQKSINSFCYVGAMLDSSKFDSSGLPIDGSYPITVTDAMKAALKTDCLMDDETITQLGSATVSIAVEASSSTAYDKLITFAMSAGGQTQTYPIYYKNSGGKIAIGQFSASGTAPNVTVTHSIMVQDLNTNLFCMEHFYRTFPATADATTGGMTGGSFSYYRGFYDKNTGEVRFFSNMGNSYYQKNNTFVSISANENEAQAGAYLSRTTDENTALTGAFVCFLKADGAFVNNTGCTENASEDRKTSWSKDSTLWSTVAGKTYDAWGDTPVTIPEFDKTTMYTLEPNYK